MSSLDATDNWKNDKARIAESFNIGIEELQKKNPSLLKGYEGAFKLKCQTNPNSWTDSKRVKETVYAVGAMIDTRPVNIKVIKDHKSLFASQPMRFGQDDNYNAMLMSIYGKDVFVNLKQGVQGDERNVRFLSPEFFSAWADNFSKAGGTIKDFGSDPSNAKQWTNIFDRAGLNMDTKIPVYYNIYGCSSNTEFAMFSKSYGNESKIMTWTWTSSGHFGMTCMDTSYDDKKPVRDCCSGVWKMNKDGNLDICAVKMTASDKSFTVDELNAVVQSVESEAKDKKAPNMALFPFAGNEKLEGCWIAQLSIPLDKQLTRGWGRSRGLVSKPNPEFYFPEMKPGEVIRPMTDMPDIDKNFRLGEPVLTISSMIVQGNNMPNVSTSDEEKKASGIALATAVIKQFSDMHDMVETCTKAVISDIHNSEHSIDETKLSEDQKKILNHITGSYFDV